jgi:hypothetical protein
MTFVNRAVTVVATLAVATVLPQWTPMASATTDCDIPASGAIDATDVEGLDAVECDVIGRQVDLGDVVLDVPEPGSGVALEALSDETAEADASASIYTAPDGTISVESAALDPGPDPRPVGNQTDGCDDDYIGVTKVWKFHGTFDYYVDNEGQPGGSSYSTADTGAVLEQAGTTWHNEVSPCFSEDHSLAGSLNYAGSTTWNGDFKIVDGTSTCADRDHRSVVDTGNLNKAGTGTYVGLNCIWYNSDDIVIESDIRFNTHDYDFTYTPMAADCDESRDYDVQSVMTHEAGHTYGMKDQVDSYNFYQTMYHNSDTCENYARNLGRSDVRHLRAQYRE